MAIYINDIEDIKKRLKINDKGPAQTFLTNTCAKKMDKYVPYHTGVLANYIIEGNSIIYYQNYAAYQYYGKRKDGSHPINEANRDRSKHPLATSRWAEKMKTAEIDDIVKEVQDFIGGK